MHLPWLPLFKNEQLRTASFIEVSRMIATNKMFFRKSCYLTLKRYLQMLAILYVGLRVPFDCISAVLRVIKRYNQEAI